MEEACAGYDEQARVWNGVAGCAWVEAQTLLDQMFKPLEDLLVEVVSDSSANRVLDVGCGTGSTTLAIRRLLGAKGGCTGIDISAPMIAAARARASQDGATARFIHADAQCHPFEPASFDMVTSRFGVMFFDDAVRAFANLRRAVSEQADLCIVVWRGPEENPFMTTAESAAAPLLRNLPPRQPDAPGQFAFADRDRVHSILQASGWTGIDIRPVDLDCHFPTQQLEYFFTRLGPLGRVLHEAEGRARAQVVEAVRAAFEPYIHGENVRYSAACWIVSARAAGVAYAREKAAKS